MNVLVKLLKKSRQLFWSLDDLNKGEHTFLAYKSRSCCYLCELFLTTRILTILSFINLLGKMLIFPSSFITCVSLRVGARIIKGFLKVIKQMAARKLNYLQIQHSNREIGNILENSQIKPTGTGVMCRESLNTFFWITKQMATNKYINRTRLEY